MNINNTRDPKIDDILTFWFGNTFNNGIPSPPRDKYWFSVDPKTDQIIKKRFEIDLLLASDGNYDHWQSTPEGSLALIILLDQFSRNIYRGTAQAFAFDDKATQICLSGLEQKYDRQLVPIFRVFYYMPLEHQESLQKQTLCVSLFERMLNEETEIAKVAETNLRFAIIHKEIIEQFGRFPHRNKLLGRQSSDAEVNYLAQSNNTFGQG